MNSVLLAVGGMLALQCIAAAAQPRLEQAVAQIGTLGSVATPITQYRLLLLQEKVARVEAIMNAVAIDMRSRGLGPEHHRWMRDSLYAMPVSVLREIGLPTSFEEASQSIVKEARVARTAAKLGQPTAELVYTPIAPCRYIDTRVVGGALAGPRRFDVGMSGLPYGGSNSCDPKAAAGGDASRIGAIAINVAIVGPTSAPGYIGVRPAGDTSLTAFVNWYESGAAVQSSNAGIVTLGQSQTSYEIEFFGGPTNIVADIFGVFVAPVVERSTMLPAVVFDAAGDAVGPYTLTPDYGGMPIREYALYRRNGVSLLLELAETSGPGLFAFRETPILFQMPNCSLTGKAWIQSGYVRRTILGDHGYVAKGPTSAPYARYVFSVPGVHNLTNFSAASQLQGGACVAGSYGSFNGIEVTFRGDIGPPVFSEPLSVR